jgi:hypothetical protein
VTLIPLLQACSGAIVGKHMKIDDENTWHIECFTCTNCKKGIVGMCIAKPSRSELTKFSGGFVEKNNKLVCEECINKL